MNVLVRKMSSLKLLKVELILGTVFSAIAMIGIPISIFCIAPDLLREPLAWGIVFGVILFFGLVGYGLFVHPYRLYRKLPDVQLEYDDEFLYIHSKKEAKIPLADLTYVHITAELPFLLQKPAQPKAHSQHSKVQQSSPQGTPYRFWTKAHGRSADLMATGGCL